MAKFDPGWDISRSGRPAYPPWRVTPPIMNPGFQWIYFFLSILMVRLFHIRYFENGPLAPGYPSCKRDEIKMRDYMGMWVIPPTWGPPLPCKQALDLLLFLPFSLPPPSSLLKLPIVVIQKFRYHGNLRSHFSSLWWRDCVCGGRAS